MPEPISIVEELAGLLATANGRPRIDRGRVAPSTLYDIDYHVAIVACAFAANSTLAADGSRRVFAPWLKMLQFIAARPSLARELKLFVASESTPNLMTWSRMPRGYLGDETHDATVEYLVATGALARDGEHLVGGQHVGVLEELAKKILALDLFQTERAVLADLKEVRVTKAMLRRP